MLQQKLSNRLVAQVELNAFFREPDLDACFDVGTATQSNSLPEHVPDDKTGEVSEGAAALEVSRIPGDIVQADHLLRKQNLHRTCPNGLAPDYLVPCRRGIWTRAGRISSAVHLDP